MTITQLYYVLAIAEHKNFTKAAEKCFFKQPTLSTQIQKLEEELMHKRWEWVLNEMIFAFENKVSDDWEGQFHSGESDIVWKPINCVDSDGEKYYEMTLGPNDTHEFDKEGYTAYQDRISNGFRLFGKYYEALWD